MEYTVTVDGELFEIEVGSGGRAWINQEPYQVDLQHVGGKGEYSLLVNNRSYDVHVAEGGNGHRSVTVGARLYHTELRRGNGLPRPGDGCPDRKDNGAGKSLAAHMEIRAPLPGLLVELRVQEGERVEEQQVVAVLESMKMNLEVRAPRAGLVRDLCTAPEQQVAQDQLLVVLSPNGSCCDEYP